MAGDTDGKPRDPADKDATAAGGRRSRGVARREPTTIDLAPVSVTEVAAAESPSGGATTADVATAATDPEPATGADPMARPDPSSPDALTSGPEPAPPATTDTPTANVEPPTETADAAPPAGDPDPVRASERPAPEDSVAPAPPPMPAPPPARRPGLAAPLAVGLAGGVIGAGLVALVMSLIGPGADTPDRLTALETAVGDRATRRTTEALEKRAQAAETALQGLRGDLTGLAARPQVAPGDVTMLGQRVDRLDRAVAQLAARPAPSGEAQAQAPVQLPPVVVAGRESAALAVAMLIRDAVSRGTPFARELAALEAGGADPALAARLKPFAQSGAPPAPALAAAFAPQAAALARMPDPGASAGVVDRVTALIGGAVRIRPVGEPAGEKPGAIGARAETALKRGDLAAALKDLETLPAESKAGVQPFVDRLRARVAAGQAADSLVTAAVEQVIAVTASSGVPTR
jgi:hypothetical protein